MKDASDDYTPAERNNLALPREYIEISYDPKRASARAVAHLCGANNRFIAPSRFPDIHTLEEYAEDHSFDAILLMAIVRDSVYS